MTALAHCAECSLWLEPWQSCLHIAPVAGAVSPFAVARNAAAAPANPVPDRKRSAFLGRGEVVFIHAAENARV